MNCEVFGVLLCVHYCVFEAGSCFVAPGTPYIDQAGLEPVADPPASVFLVLGLQGSTTTPGLINSL